MQELAKIPEIKEIRGMGLMIGIEFNEPVAELRKKLLFEKKIFNRRKRHKYNPPAASIMPDKSRCRYIYRKTQTIALMQKSPV